MQYVRSFSGSVTKAWNSVNPATLSGAIDVIVVEQENGDLACSPFHVRFGKFSLLRPSEKKVEFRVNGEKTDFAMKLGDGGEAFFVFETTGFVPEEMQTSPLVSPSASPRQLPVINDPASLQEPEYLNIAEGDDTAKGGEGLSVSKPRRVHTDDGNTLHATPSEPSILRPASGDWSSFNLERSASEEALPTTTSIPRRYTLSEQRPARGRSPPPLDPAAAVERALALSKKLSSSNIPTQITDRGDVMLDMNGYKLSDDDSLQAEVIARKILAEEIDGDYDIGALIGADRNGNLWIYSSEEAKEQAYQEGLLCAGMGMNGDTVSESGYLSDDARSEDSGTEGAAKSAANASSTSTTPPAEQKKPAADPSRNYVKTLRLTSAQIKSLNLKPGANSVSFSVGKATCNAFMYNWKSNVPIVISDIDGTITKSDALGHVLTMLGRDWTHLGVAKLYTDIAANGYHMLYLTSRSVGQADSTRNYLNGIVQDRFKIPKGPVIMSPDRTMAALRREVYLRKPEVFKMACLRDILNLFGPNHNPFYAGFGNRLTDALSYRSVNIPSTRIFTINSNAEVSLDLLTLTKYKSSYVNMRDLVDHFFPPVSLLSTDEGYTDFNYWREPLPDPDEFSDSDDEDDRKPVMKTPLIIRGNVVVSAPIEPEEDEEDEEEDEEDDEEEEEGDEEDEEEEEEDEEELEEELEEEGDLEEDEEAMKESYMTGMSEVEAHGEEEEEDGDEEYFGEEDVVEGEKLEDTQPVVSSETDAEQPIIPVVDEKNHVEAEPIVVKPAEESSKNESSKEESSEATNIEVEQEDRVKTPVPAINEADSAPPPEDKETTYQEAPPSSLTNSLPHGVSGIKERLVNGKWMKNDVDRSILGQVIDAAERELAGVAEKIGEEIGTHNKHAENQGDAEEHEKPQGHKHTTSTAVAAAGGLVGSFTHGEDAATAKAAEEEERKERFVASSAL